MFKCLVQESLCPLIGGSLFKLRRALEIPGILLSVAGSRPLLELSPSKSSGGAPHLLTVGGLKSEICGSITLLTKLVVLNRVSW